jgi:CRP/FNR family transcriptional regulator, cyclic AMP receptor protein
MVAAGAALGEFAHRLSEAERSALFVAGRQRTYPRNARVFCEGDRSDFIVVIIEGRVKIVVTTAEGGESLLGVRGPGALVGELAAFDPGPRVASVVALEPLTVRVLAADEFRAFIAQQPEAGLELIRVLIGRLREADRRRAEFGVYDSVSRVAHLLGDLIDGQASGPAPIEVRLSQQEIAGLVGASRESVARALGVLRSRHLVATGRRTITILDPEALRSIAG